MNFLINSAVKTVVNKELFNPGTSSCDVVNPQTNEPCCTNKKDAKKRKMKYCGPNK